MNQHALGTKLGTGTSLAAVSVAWLPHIETALRIGASAIAIIAGIYAILNYRADLKRKLSDKHHKKN